MLQQTSRAQSRRVACPCVTPNFRRLGALAIVQDRACDLAYSSWKLTPIYDPDPLSEGVEGIDDSEGIFEDFGQGV